MGHQDTEFTPFSPLLKVKRSGGKKEEINQTPKAPPQVAVLAKAEEPQLRFAPARQFTIPTRDLKYLWVFTEPLDMSQSPLPAQELIRGLEDRQKSKVFSNS